MYFRDDFYIGPAIRQPLFVEVFQEMDIIEKTIGNVAGGRVLDVATQEGHFVRLLMKNLQSYTQIVGIDVDEDAIRKAQELIGDKKIQFLVMNAEQMDFAGESFDTVSISASLHHMGNVQQVLAEVGRVLKSGGHLIFAEMHRDGQTVAEFTSVYLHHWIGDVDTALGGIHNHTMYRQELVEHIEGLGLRETEYYDVVFRETDPLERANIEQLDDLVARVSERARGASSYAELKKQGDELRRRLREVGVQREPILLAIGKK